MIDYNPIRPLVLLLCLFFIPTAKSSGQDGFVLYRLSYFPKVFNNQTRNSVTSIKIIQNNQDVFFFRIPVLNHAFLLKPNLLIPANDSTTQIIIYTHSRIDSFLLSTYACSNHFFSISIEEIQDSVASIAFDKGDDAHCRCAISGRRRAIQEDLYDITFLNRSFYFTVDTIPYTIEQYLDKFNGEFYKSIIFRDF
jgi:hypothetical protein